MSIYTVTLAPSSENGTASTVPVERYRGCRLQISPFQRRWCDLSSYMASTYPHGLDGDYAVDNVKVSSQDKKFMKQRRLGDLRLTSRPLSLKSLLSTYTIEEPDPCPGSIRRARNEKHVQGYCSIGYVV